MVSSSATLAERDPELPVRINWYFPGVAPDGTAMVSVKFGDVPLELTVSPGGSPPIVKEIAPVKPPDGITTTAKVPEVPRAALRPDGDTLNPYPPTGVTGTGLNTTSVVV